MRWIVVALATALVIPCVATAQQRYPRVPPSERALLHMLSKYNAADASAPNQIQEDAIDAEFRRRFCSTIPRGPVRGWVGTLKSMTQTHHPMGIQVEIELPLPLYSGSLAIELSVGNGYWYGLPRRDTQPLGALLVRAGTPLYEALAKMPDNDSERIEFSGQLGQFVSLTACEAAISSSTYFDAIRLESVRDLGPDR